MVDFGWRPHRNRQNACALTRSERESIRVRNPLPRPLNFHPMKTNSSAWAASTVFLGFHRRPIASIVAVMLLGLSCWPRTAQAQCCVDISGEWDVEESITLTIYFNGYFFDETTQSGGGSVVISQNGCKFTFISEVPDPFNYGRTIRLTRSGMIMGDQAVFTGKALARIPGASCSENELRGEGTISSSGFNSSISFDTTGGAECRGGGDEAEFFIEGSATFSRGGRLAFPPGVGVMASSLSVSNRFAVDGSLLPGTNVTFTAQVSGDTEQVTFQWLRNGKAIPRATNDTHTITNVQCSDAGHYAVTIRHAGCAITSATAALRVNGSTNATDNPPALTITSPSVEFTRVSNNVHTITGTVKEDRGLQGIYLQHGSGPFERVSASSNWSAMVNLEPGTNTFRIKAVDGCGHESSIVRRTLYYVLTSALTVRTNGNGSVTPALDGQQLEVGRNYMLTATPSNGWAFSHWSGGENSTDGKLTFGMSPNLMLTAHFIPNPFIPLRGQFNGLFCDMNEIRADSAGSFTLTLTEPGNYSASLVLGGKKLSASGRFNAEGKAMNIITHLRTNRITVNWCLRFDGSDRIEGSVSNSQWVAVLEGDRATAAATNVAAPGAYTLVFPGETADDGLSAASSAPTGGPPQGDSFGTATVDAKGVVMLKGDLAEKLSITQKVPLSKDGHWPLYVSLYSGQGMVLGWVHFADEESSDFGGLATWIKPASPKAKYHPSGFTHENSLVGSRYRAPTGAVDRIFPFDTNGVVVLTGGNLSQSFTNEVDWGLNNIVTNKGPLPLSLKFKLPSGLMSGSFTPTGATRAVPFNGVVLQKARTASGYFLGTNTSGRVLLRVEP